MSAPTVLRCELHYQVFARSHFIFHIHAAHSADQFVVDERFRASCAEPLQMSTDTRTGNRIIRFNAGPGPLKLQYDATVDLHRRVGAGGEREMEVEEIPTDVLAYLLPSRYCQSDLLSAESQRIFGQIPRGYGRVEAVCQWIRDNIEYRIGTSGPNTTAYDVYTQRKGVCRDYAQLAITFCRALNIPARLVVGYSHFAEPPQDFHAMVEVWLDNRWVLVDPTQLAHPRDLVRIGTGVDAKDVAFATIYGAMQMTYMQIQIDHHGGLPVEVPDPRQATMGRREALDQMQGR